MKRSDLIKELMDLYNSIPEEASSYHIVDILIGRAERLGMLPPTFTKPIHIVNGLAYTHYLVNEWDLEEEYEEI